MINLLNKILDEVKDINVLTEKQIFKMEKLME